ncbi:hypothetical protein [Luteolibacter flavescens]|uniref:hypothetical protein n=1 Tax=Luteolibacter flavescens TaxID=1859460 RepID=UPI002221DECC|nr:hypothetical protein [Luteolibacter flavescens]
MLPIVNAVGCVVLVGFIFIQWLEGQGLERDLGETRTREILEKNARTEAEQQITQLRSDIQGLKDSVDSIRQAAEAAEKELVIKNEEIAKFAAGLEEARAMIVTWEAAVKERDEALKLRDEALQKRDEAIAARDSKLKEVNAQLVATRKRLDEAVAELKKAGAR